MLSWYVAQSLLFDIIILLQVLGIIMGIWSILGVEFFATYNAEYFGTFARAMFTMWQVMTLEGWAEKADVLVYENDLPWAAFFFVSYIFIASIIMTNVVVAILLEKYLESTDQGKGHASATQPANRVKNNAVAPTEGPASITKVSSQQSAKNMAHIWKKNSLEKFDADGFKRHQERDDDVDATSSADKPTDAADAIENTQSVSVREGEVPNTKSLPNDSGTTGMLEGKSRSEMIDFLTAHLAPSRLQELDENTVASLYHHVDNNIDSINLHASETASSDALTTSLLPILRTALR